MENYPNADFYYKIVAKIDNKLYSIYDASVEYKIGQIMHQKVESDKKGGYFVYKDP